MDLGEIGVILVAEGEAEARAAIERFVRARDAAVRAMDEASQREIRAAEAIERAIQREIREYDGLVRAASGLRRSYEDLVASFNPLNRAQLEYARNIEMLDEALKANVINEQQRARAMELLRERMEQTAESDVSRNLEEIARKTAEQTKAVQDAQQAYDNLMASMDPLIAAQQKYDRGIDVLNQAESRKIITTEERIEAEKRLQAQLAKDQSSVRAAQSRDETRELERNKAAHAQLVGELERLRATVNPVVRQQQLYDQALKTTTRAVEKKIITEKESIRIMEDVRQKMASMGHIVNQNGEVMSRADTAWQRWARGGVQNAGYQIADFAVQVQGGTSAIVAFGQQAPQFLGMFGAIGAAVGAVVAIAAAVANVFVLTATRTRELTDVMGELSSSIDQYSRSAERLRDEDLALEFGNMTSEVERLTRATIALDQASALANLSASIKSINEESTKLGFLDKVAAFVIANRAPITDRTALEDAQAVFREINFNDLGLSIGYDIFTGMMEGITASANRGDVEATARQLTDLIQRAMPDGMLDEEGLLRPGAALLIQYRDLTLAAAQLAAEINGSADATERQRREAEEAARQAEEAAREAERAQKVRERATLTSWEMLSSLRQEREVQEKILATGRDGAEVEEIRKRHAREVYFAKVNQLAVDEFIRNMLKSQYDLTVAASDAAADSVNRFADESARARRELEPIAGIMSSIREQIDGISLSNLGRAARLAALRAGGTEQEASLAGQIATERARLSPALGAVDAGIRFVARQQLEERIAGLTEQSQIEAEISAILDDRRNKERDGGKQQKDTIGALLERVRLERELLGLSDEEREVREAAAQSEMRYSEAYIQAAVMRLEADRAVIEQRREMERIADFIGDNLESALMSIADRTKTVSDAFREMARLIIAELYRVLVVKQIVGSFSADGGGILGAAFGVIPSASGNVISSGSIVPYANGGIVNSPTLFPMRGGVGLMGEAGPEAILPLRRSSSGKLGVLAEGAGGVTVVQNFSVSANGDESVKRIVRGEMPMFAEAAKAAVIDARRRGGAMRAAFS